MDFPPPVKEAAEAIVNSRCVYRHTYCCLKTNYNFGFIPKLCISVEIYGRMSTDLLPTPAKSHYLFNLRDLSKCIQGR